MLLPHSQGFPDGEVQVVVGAGGDEVDEVVFAVDVNEFSSPVHHGNTGDATRLKLAHCLSQLATLGDDLEKL